MLRRCLATLAVTLVLFTGGVQAADDAPGVAKLAETIGAARGFCAVVGGENTSLPLELARRTELTLYVQLDNEQPARELRQQAERAGLLGERVFVAVGGDERIHLADNLADAVIVAGGASADRQELLRVARPGGKVIVGGEVIEKPRPAGADDWTHPYHGPDNNPRSSDAVVRAPYLTQFHAAPWYGPMPEVTVAAGGRLFKAFGHISIKRREWPLVNKLAAINAYNGTTLWQRELTEGFMVHRNTMIATPDVLLLADDKSCQLIDAASGETKDEIIPPDEVTKVKVWKWMALEDGVLYAMFGPAEKPAAVLRGERTQPGWPWNGLGDGYAQQDYPWGFGNTLAAIDLASKRVLWRHTETEPLDSRATCMAGGRLFFYSHQKFLGCLDAKSGRVLWKTSDSRTLAAIGEHGKAQNARLGFSSTAYAKCTTDAIYFAGPQRQNLAAVSAKDGSLLWSYPHGNFQLILRDDGLYAMGRTETSKKFDLVSGNVLADLQCFRGNCTRATATPDSIFTRGYRHSGTQRLILDGAKSTRIGLMRPACQDGVLIANGQLYWGPWMCDCNLSLVGIISLGSAGDFQFNQQADESERLQVVNGEARGEFETTKADWSAYRGDNARSGSSAVAIADSVRELWRFETPARGILTAPVTAGGLAIIAGADGGVRALDAASGETRWTAYTGGRIFYPPAIAKGRVYVGSGDGWVYALDAASGKTAWRFRAAPIERKIPVYGHITSNWPVASGVLVDDGVVYAAAGIASYDGTHVYALDAATGRIRWQNNTSGRLVAGDLVSGISVQGHLLLHNDRLYMAGGNVVSPAMYDVKTGACLNQLDDEWIDDSVEVSPNKPDMDKIKSPRGRELFLVGDQVHVFDRLLYSPREDQLGRYFNQRFVQASRGEVIIRGRPGQLVRLAAPSASDGQLAGMWENRDFVRADALAVTPNAVLVAGQLAGGDAGADYALAALDVQTGQPRWTQKLPGPPGSWGLAVDRDGRILATLDDGRVVCYGAG